MRCRSKAVNVLTFPPILRNGYPGSILTPIPKGSKNSTIPIAELWKLLGGKMRSLEDGVLRTNIGNDV